MFLTVTYLKVAIELSQTSRVPKESITDKLRKSISLFDWMIIIGSEMNVMFEN